MAARGDAAFRSPLRSRKGYFSADSIVVESAVSVLGALCSQRVPRSLLAPATVSFPLRSRELLCYVMQAHASDGSGSNDVPAN